ncbi:MAG: peptidylprolyl isomerase [Phycisphaerales bacterium]
MRTASPLLALMLAATASMAGCSSDHLADAPPAEGRPAALVDGRPITWDDLQPGLAELAGGEILEEAVLDSILSERCRRQGIAITADMIAAERALLIESMDPSPDRAEELLRVVRAQRRLGNERFNAALRRSAMLRVLAPVTKSEQEAELLQVVRVRQSERSVIRIISVLNEVDAAAARARVADPQNAADPMRFSAVASEVSQDESRLRGGLVGEVSAADTTVPAALREAVAKTQPGRVTQVIATGKVFVVAFVQERLPPLPAATRQELEVLARQASIRVQRRAMEQLAKSMLAEAHVQPLDRALGWSWDQRVK